MTTYTLSFNVKLRCAKLKRRPWWDIFGADRLEMVDCWESRVFAGLTKAQADLFTEASRSGWTSEQAHLLLRLMSRDGPIHGIDLRSVETRVSYVRSSEGLSVQVAT
jgi:hypothetical protein